MNILYSTFICLCEIGNKKTLGNRYVTKKVNTLVNIIQYTRVISPEAEFLDEIQTKVSRVFLLAVQIISTALP